MLNCDGTENYSWLLILCFMIKSFISPFVTHYRYSFTQSDNIRGGRRCRKLYLAFRKILAAIFLLVVAEVYASPIYIRLISETGEINKLQA